MHPARHVAVVAGGQVGGMHHVVELGPGMLRRGPPRHRGRQHLAGEHRIATQHHAPPCPGRPVSHADDERPEDGLGLHPRRVRRPAEPERGGRPHHHRGEDGRVHLDGHPHGGEEHQRHEVVRLGPAGARRRGEQPEPGGEEGHPGEAQGHVRDKARVGVAGHDAQAQRQRQEGEQVGGPGRAVAAHQPEPGQQRRHHPQRHQARVGHVPGAPRPRPHVPEGAEEQAGVVERQRSEQVGDSRDGRVLGRPPHALHVIERRVPVGHGPERPVAQPRRHHAQHHEAPACLRGVLRDHRPECPPVDREPCHRERRQQHERAGIDGEDEVPAEQHQHRRGVADPRRQRHVVRREGAEAVEAAHAEPEAQQHAPHHRKGEGGQQ